MSLHFLNPAARRDHVLALAISIADQAEPTAVFRPRIAHARAALARLKADDEQRVLAELEADSDDES